MTVKRMLLVVALVALGVVAYVVAGLPSRAAVRSIACVCGAAVKV